jgi:hypothetical protein
MNQLSSSQILKKHEVSWFVKLLFVCSLFNDVLAATKTIQRRVKGWQVKY